MSGVMPVEAPDLTVHDPPTHLSFFILRYPASPDIFDLGK